MSSFLKIIVLVVSIFAPFSFAGTEPWAFSFIQVGIFGIFLALFSKRHHFSVSPLIKPVCFILGFLALLAVLQSFFTTSILKPPLHYPSTFSRLYTLEHASLFVTWLTAVLAISQLFQTRKEIMQALGIVAISGFLVALSVFFWSDGEYVSFFLGYKHIGKGPFFNRDHAGTFLAICSFALAAIPLSLYAIYKHHPEEKEKMYSKQFVCWFLFVLTAASVIYTKSRGGMLALLTGILSLIFLLGISLPHHTRKRTYFGFLALMLAAICGFSIANNIDAINRYADRAGDSFGDNNTRIVLYKAVPKILEKYPAGIGIGSLPLVIEQNCSKRIGRYVERLHSDWLEILTGIGWGGAIFVIAGLVWYIIIAIKTLFCLHSKKKVLFASILAGQIAMLTACAFDYEFFVPSNALMFFILTGLACSPSFHKDHVHTYHIYIPAKCVAAVICLLAVIVPLRKTIAWRYVFLGKSRFKDEKLVLFEKAKDVYPGARYGLRAVVGYYNTANGEERNNDIENAKKHKKRAMELTMQFLRMYPKDTELSAMYYRLLGVQKRPPKKLKKWSVHKKSAGSNRKKPATRNRIK